MNELEVKSKLSEMKHWGYRLYLSFGKGIEIETDIRRGGICR